MSANGNLNGIFEVGRLITLRYLMDKMRHNRFVRVEESIQLLAVDVKYPEDAGTPLQALQKWKTDAQFIGVRLESGIVISDQNNRGRQHFRLTLKILKQIVERINELTNEKGVYYSSLGKTELEEVGTQIQFLLQAFDDDCDQNVFMVIDPQRARYYDYAEEVAFSEAVHSEFPHLKEDIIKAAQCYACGFWTESATKCLVVVEAVVQLLAKKLRVNLNDEKGRPKHWHNLLDEAKKASSTMGREKKERYTKIIGHLYEAKEERNDFAHARNGKIRKCQEPKARQIWNETKGFLEDYAEFLVSSRRKKKITASQSSQ